MQLVVLPSRVPWMVQRGGVAGCHDCKQLTRVVVRCCALNVICPVQFRSRAKVVLRVKLCLEGDSAARRGRATEVFVRLEWDGWEKRKERRKREKRVADRQAFILVRNQAASQAGRLHAHDLLLPLSPSTGFPRPILKRLGLPLPPTLLLQSSADPSRSFLG